ncbi:MAG TPA: aminodeoxychorismate synthase component I [bacterium]|nr:aminodeoxychorismate synthase component I [bacterium]HPN42299.1 aminodeoxychorismate synthase component I [bacterium]
MKVTLFDNTLRRWLIFQNPVHIIRADNVQDVNEALQETETAVNKSNIYAAGFIAYEAAPAFDPSLTVHAQPYIPLLLFGLFEEPVISENPFTGVIGDTIVTDPAASISRDEYVKRIAVIKSHIRNGYTYQVNYTFPILAAFRGDPLALFLKLYRSQKGDYAAFIEFADYAICSASPELFFILQGDKLVSRPMKGTARRGNTLGEDRMYIDELQRSEKNRAENVMIVDMIRNDMGRIAKTGTVKVPKLFQIEQYPAVLQMTSTVECETTASITEIMTALFPCASITGAPKVKTMEIITQLENRPRGIYTGTIGYITPGRRACFNVAIRSAVVNKAAATLEFGVGSGIVWDSQAEAEYDECLLKANILNQKVVEFRLLESILWEPETGYFLLDRHLQRLADSARYFGYRVDVTCIRTRLEQLAANLTKKSKIRVLVDEQGRCEIEYIELPVGYKQNLRVCLASHTVNTDDPFLHHKTTRREVYDEILQNHTGYDDVILVNHKGEITESCYTNVVVRQEDRLVTPPVSCGLLAGTFRAELLAGGEIMEKIITVDELHRTQEIYLINSVRKWVRVHL